MIHLIKQKFLLIWCLQWRVLDSLVLRMDNAQRLFRWAESLLSLFVELRHALVNLVQMVLQGVVTLAGRSEALLRRHFVQLVVLILTVDLVLMDELLRAHGLRWRTMILKRGAGSH